MQHDPAAAIRFDLRSRLNEFLLRLYVRVTLSFDPHRQWKYFSWRSKIEVVEQDRRDVPQDSVDI